MLINYPDKITKTRPTSPAQLNQLNPLKSSSSVELEELIGFLINFLKPHVLSDLQEKVLRGSWDNKTFCQIADITHNDPDYLKGVGSKLWHILSEALSEEVTKRNLKLVAKRNYEKLKKFNQDCQQREINTPKVTKLATNSTDLCNEFVTNKYRDWGEAVDTSCFYGRMQELATLKKWIIQDRCRLTALLGMGGIGKTALASILAKQVESEFEVVIWKSLRNAPDFKSLLAELIVAICDRETLYIADTIDGQIDNLMKCLRQKSCLLIFDGLENIFASGQLCGQYLEQYQGYGQLLRRIQDERHKSCVVITSREKPNGLSLREGKTSVVKTHTIKGLSNEDALNIMDYVELTASKSTFKRLLSLCDQNPLIFKMTISTIISLFSRDVQAFLNGETILYGSIWKLLDQQFQRLTSPEKQIMNYLALEKDILNFEKLLHIAKNKISRCQLMEGLESLEGRSLITVNETFLVQQSTMTKYVKESLFK